MCDERRAGLERPHYITNVLKAGGRTVHWKIALIACTIGANRVFSNLLQTKKSEIVICRLIGNPQVQRRVHRQKVFAHPFATPCTTVLQHPSGRCPGCSTTGCLRG
jgi:hypothetical protein